MGRSPKLAKVASPRARHGRLRHPLPWTPVEAAHADGGATLVVVRTAAEVRSVRRR
jgi:hypothetical protein